MSEEQATYNVKHTSLDKQKLLEWLQSEIDSCNIVRNESDQMIRWECERIEKYINAGMFDSSIGQDNTAVEVLTSSYEAIGAITCGELDASVRRTLLDVMHKISPLIPKGTEATK